MYCTKPEAPSGSNWKVDWTAPGAAGPAPATAAGAAVAAAAPSSASTQFGRPSTNAGRRRTPRLAQSRGATALPRRVTNGPSASVVNLATAPAGPKTRPISAPAASILDAGSNGYLPARFCWKSCNTCADHSRLTSASVGPMRTVKDWISGRTSKGFSVLLAASLAPVSICSSTNFKASASSELLPSKVAAISWRAAGPASPWFFIALKRDRIFERLCR